MSDDPKRLAAAIAAKIIAAVQASESDELEGLIGRIEQTHEAGGAIFLAGAGRSGLIARAFTMRLVHIGVRAHCVGGITTPAIHAQDLLIVLSRSGETPTSYYHAERAKEIGAQITAVTASVESRLQGVADQILLLTIGARSVGDQYGGSLFEQTALVVLDAIANSLIRRLEVDHTEMDARHANLE